MPTPIPFTQWKAQQGGSAPKVGAVPFSQWKAKQPTPSPLQGALSGVVDAEQGVARGVAKSELATTKGLSDFGELIARNTVGRLTNAVSGKGFTVPPPQDSFSKVFGGEQGAKNVTEPKGAAEDVGYFGGTAAQFALPTGKIKQIEGAIDLAKGAPELISTLGKLGVKNAPMWGNFLMNTGKMGLKILVNGLESAGISGLQTENPKTALETGIIGGASPILEKAAGGISKALPTILGFTSGIKTGAIKAAQDAPGVIAKGIKMTSAEVRDQAEKALGGLYKNMHSAFSTGLDALQKKVPFQAASKQFNNIRSFFGNALNDMKTGIPSVFRDFGVAVENGGKTLNFDKLNSPIVKASEQNNLQRVWSTILRQTNFSPVGIQRVAARIEALTKHGENNETSAIIGKIKDAYDKVIERFHPDLGKLRTTYGKTAQKLEDISSIVGSSMKSPTQIQTAINKLTSIFDDDKETYLNIIKDFAQRTNTDFPALIASDEFKRIMPDFIRGVGGAGVLAAGHFMNPWLYLLAPLFSPRAVGALVTKGAEVAPAFGKAAMAGAKALPSSLEAILAPDAPKPASPQPQNPVPPSDTGIPGQ